MNVIRRIFILYDGQNPPCKQIISSFRWFYDTIPFLFIRSEYVNKGNNVVAYEIAHSLKKWLHTKQFKRSSNPDQKKEENSIPFQPKDLSNIFVRFNPLRSAHHDSNDLCIWKTGGATIFGLFLIEISHCYLCSVWNVDCVCMHSPPPIEFERVTTQKSEQMKEFNIHSAIFWCARHNWCWADMSCMFVINLA